MNQAERKIILETLSILVGKRLNWIGRAAAMASLGFGDPVLMERIVRKEDGTFGTEKQMIPPYALHIDGIYRLICGEQVFLGKGDVFEPASGQQNKEDFDWESFEWDIIGNNRYDEIGEKLLETSSPPLIVEKVSVNRLGDLSIHLTNGFKLEALIDTSGEEECWRFFEVGNEDSPHLVVTGQGIEE